MKVLLVEDFLSSNHVHLEPSGVSKCPLSVFEFTNTAVARMVRTTAVNHLLFVWDIFSDDFHYAWEKRQTHSTISFRYSSLHNWLVHSNKKKGVDNVHEYIATIQLSGYCYMGAKCLFIRSPVRVWTCECSVWQCIPPNMYFIEHKYSQSIAVFIIFIWVEYSSHSQL